MPSSPPASSAPSGLRLAAMVRACLGLSTRQLAHYLGVSMGFVTHLEAGRKPLPGALLPRLLLLARLLPPPLGTGLPLPELPPPHDPLLPLPAPERLAPPLPDAPAPPEPETLRRRLRDQRLRLLTLSQHLAAEQARMAGLARRHHGLALLRAALPPPEAAEAAHYARWLARLSDDLTRDDPTPAVRAAALHLLAARVAGLRAEVAALAV